MSNPTGTAPANFVGTSTNPGVSPLQATQLNQAFTLCEWLSNKDAHGGYIGQDSSGNAGISGNFFAGGNIVSDGMAEFNGGLGNHLGTNTYNAGINANASTDAVFCFNIAGQTATYLSLKTSNSQIAFGGYAWPADVWQISSAGDTVQTGRVTAATLTLTGLPTSPGAAGSGVVWNNNGVLSIS